MSIDACERIQDELSAYIDDESPAAERASIEAHLQGCDRCRSEEAVLRAVRKLVRVHPVEDIPDLAAAIMERIEATTVTRLQPWHERIRIAAVSAAAAALVVLGASLPFGDGSPEVANASEITERVRLAARDLEAYEATFSIVERGWHPEVPVRKMTARLAYAAPESIRLEIDDNTTYPTQQWPRNDVTLVADPHRWWIEEPSSCPPAGLPECASPVSWSGVLERRTVVHRQPFDGTTGLPTDIVIPLQTLATSDGYEVLGQGRVLDRDAYRLQMNVRDATPLLSALQAGGSWREFHPLDVVEMWIDAETWFPLRFTVSAGTAPDRALWAERRALNDRVGSILLDVRAQSFSEPDQEPTFDVPRSGILQDGGFKDGTAQLAVLPREVAGLEPYRSGSTATSQITSFSDGMTYLKVVRSKAKADPGDLRVAEEVELANGPGYYFPASEVLGRHLEIFSHGRSVQLFSNLPRDTLLSVAGSLAIGGESAPRTIRKPGGVVIDRLDPRAVLSRFSLTLEQLPLGYLPASAARTRVEGPGTETVTLYLRRPEAEFDGLGIRLVMSTPVAFLPPSSEEFVDLTIGGHRARWSAERGELEWLEGTTYRAVLTPSSDLSTALQIVEAIG